MEKFQRCFWGYLRISIHGQQLERFLNLCRQRGIVLHMLQRTGKEEMQGILLANDFRQLFPVRRKTKVHIRILEKHGFPFIFQRNKKRKVFWMGFLLCCCMLLVLSGRVWNIHVEGNIINTTSGILDFLKTEGIYHGMAKKDVKCYEIADIVRKKYPEITWVSANLKGTRLILKIQEGEQREVLKNTNQSPCNIVSDTEGKIVKMVTRSGIPLLKAGDTCQKGDILVSGRLDILNDSQEITQFEYVHADADIYVEHTMAFYDEFPLKYEKEIFEGEIKKDYYIKIGNWYFSTYNGRKDGWKTSVEDFPLFLTENFCLPLNTGKIISKKYRKEESVYTEKEAKSVAVKHMQIYEEKLIEKGVQISENNVKIEVNRTACISAGTLTVIEKTGTEQSVDVQEQPQERTA